LREDPLSIPHRIRLAIGFDLGFDLAIVAAHRATVETLARTAPRGLRSQDRRHTLAAIAFTRIAMAQEPLATKGNYLHIYDFRVMKGKEDEFIRLFEAFDYSDGNPMHKSRAQVKDGVLCRDTEDPQRFFLIAEWSDIEEHARIRKILANDIKPEFIKYIEGGKFIPKYVEVVLSTPDEILQKAAG
jgi:hypothetical protein